MNLVAITRPIDIVFNHKGLRGLLTRLRVPIGICAFFLLLIHVRGELIPYGFAISIFGAAVQTWAFASLNKNSKLCVRGPYAIVRNPMYLGRFFLLLGFLMLSVNNLTLIVFCISYWFYMKNRVLREESRLKNLFGKEYEEYCRLINRFLPRFDTPYKRAIAYFNIKDLVRNRGHLNLVLVHLAWVLVYICYHLNIIVKAK